jgi:dTMP kinase
MASDPGSPRTPDPESRDSADSRVRPPVPTQGISLDGFKAVYRIREFRLLFWGQAISALGDWVGTLAFIVAADSLSDHDPFAITAVLVLRLLPTLFATPIGGVLSDRFDRKRIMITSDLVRFVVIGLIAFIPNLIALYVAAFIHEAFSMVFLPARDALLPNIVPADRLEPANAMIMGSSFAGIPLSGPIYGAIAFLAIHFPGWMPTEHRWHANPWALTLLFDALTFILSAVLIRRMTIPQRSHPAGEVPDKFIASLREGISYILSRPLLRGLAYAVSLGMLGGGVLFALGIRYIHETLGGGDVAFGWLMGLFGLGMVLGFIGSQVQTPRGALWLIRGALLVMGGVLVTMALVPVLGIAYFMAGVFGISFSIAIIVAMSQAQANTDDEHRGRVMATVHILFRGALLFGAVAAAGVIRAFGDGVTLPVLNFHVDANQVALLLSGGLITAGVGGVRGRIGPST